MSVATFTDGSPEFLRRKRAAEEGGLIAAAQVVINRVKRAMAGGYTTGAFVIGNAINSVTKDDPAEDADGLQIHVGSNLPYVLFWELGHHNAFTRRYERVEIWAPAIRDDPEPIAAAFSRVFRRMMPEATA